METAIPRVAYSATKAALAYYTRTRSADYLSDGIRLNAVAPGYIETPATAASLADPHVAAGIRQYLAATPVGRAGKPSEVASAVAFLLGATAPFVVGSVLTIDGGLDGALRGMDWPKAPGKPSFG